MNDRPEWFAPKRYGYGNGLPLSWQGWLAIALYVAVLIAAVAVLGHRPVVLVAILVPVTILYLILCAYTTRSGWRWRWGEDK